MKHSERDAINPEHIDQGTYGRLAQMAERSLSMREAPRSIPGLSRTTLHVGGLYSSVGQSARLVSARSGVRTSLEADFCTLFNQLIFFSLKYLPRHDCTAKMYPAIT